MNKSTRREIKKANKEKAKNNEEERKKAKNAERKRIARESYNIKQRENKKAEELAEKNKAAKRLQKKAAKKAKRRAEEQNKEAERVKAIIASKKAEKEIAEKNKAVKNSKKTKFEPEKQTARERIISKKSKRKTKVYNKAERKAKKEAETKKKADKKADKKKKKKIIRKFKEVVKREGEEATFKAIEKQLRNIMSNLGSSIESFNLTTPKIKRKFIELMKQILIKRKTHSLFITIDKTNFPLNSNNIQLLEDMIINGETIIESADNYIKNSDTQMLERFLKHDFVIISSFPITHKRNSNEGAFFPYLVKDINFYNVSWAKYGIYNEINLDETEENCFITSLIQDNECRIAESKKPIISEEIIESIKRRCTNRVVTIKVIEEICQEYNICISINKCGGEKADVRTYRKKPREGESKREKPINVEPIKIGKIGDHYFHINNKNTFCTDFYLKNADEIAKLTDNIERARKCTRINKSRYESVKPNFCTSLKLLMFLEANKEKYLNPITLSDEGIAESNFRDKFNKIKKLEYDDSLISYSRSNNRLYSMLFKIEKSLYLSNYQLLSFMRKHVQDKVEPKDIEEFREKINSMKEKRLSDEKLNVIFFDVETTTDGKHQVYVICSCQINATGNTYNKRSFRNIETFLKSVPDYSICYAHNLGYDVTFLIPYLIVIGSPIMQGKRIMSLSVKYFNNENDIRQITFKDSLPLISMPLKDFPSSFGLPDIEKEVINYGAYTRQTVKQGSIHIQEFIKDFTEEEIQKCMQNIIKWEIKVNIVTKHFDHIRYATKYCETDVELLAKGVYKFQIYINELCESLNLPGINLNKIVSIPSIVNLIFDYYGCYDGVYKVSGHVREFMSRAVVGGRTMSNNNKKWRVIGNIDKKIGIEDLDKVSLYPSAMARFSGFVKGKPKIIELGAKYEDIKKYSSYIVEIKINKSLPHLLDFPLLSYVNNKGVREFSNNVEDKIFNVGKTMLEDVIKFHKVNPIDITIIRGYYYDKGYNANITTLIKELFKKRIELKKANNPMQMLIKLVMNSGYGKLIQKPISDELKIKRNTDDKATKFISKNHNKIKYYECNDHNQYFIKLIKSDRHYNYTIQGIDILDMSKRIMNEVMTLAQDLGIGLFYQDTDSMHIETGYNRQKLINLCKEYKKKYEIELLGDGLEQFNTDFPVHDNKKLKKGEEFRSYEFIVLGKKSYIDDVTYIHTNKEGKDEKVNYIHSRMKGIPKACFPKDKKETMNIYLDLFNGNEKVFDLAKSKPIFERTRTWEYSISEEFKRKVSYSGEENTVYLKE